LEASEGRQASPINTKAPERASRLSAVALASTIVRICLHFTPVDKVVDVFDELAALKGFTDVANASTEHIASRATDAVADSLQSSLNSEFSTADSGDFVAAVKAVQSVLDSVEAFELLYEAVADPALLERRLLRQHGGRTARDDLRSEVAQELFDSALRISVRRLSKSAPYVHEFAVRALPHLIRAQRTADEQLHAHERAIASLTEQGAGGDSAAFTLTSGTSGASPLEPTAPLVRGYLEYVASFAPLPLVGRDPELREMDAFITGTDGDWWAWRARPWSGKTALMTTFALSPPEHVRVAVFVIIGREASSNNREKFVAQVVPQLAHIAGVEHFRLAADQTHREDQFRDMLSRAGNSCSLRGERLALICDGLDEDVIFDTHAATSGSIAALLPARLPDGVKVVVSSRPNPGVPPDVPDNHPLRDESVWRWLQESPEADAAHDAARADLDDLVGSEVGTSIAAVLAAASGPLTAIDLSEVLGLEYRQVLEVVHGRGGRSLIPFRSSRSATASFRLAHENLDDQVIFHLSPRAAVTNRSLSEWRRARFDVLAEWRNLLHTWANDWIRKGWPAETPEYLLGADYVALLAQEGRAADVADLICHPKRAQRLYDVYTDDFVLLSQMRSAAHQLTVDGSDIVQLARVLASYERYAARSAAVPTFMLQLLVLGGDNERAVRMALSKVDHSARAHALTGLHDVAQLVADASLTRLLDELMAQSRQLTSEGGQVDAGWRWGHRKGTDGGVDSSAKVVSGGTLDHIRALLFEARPDHDADALYGRRATDFGELVRFIEQLRDEANVGDARQNCWVAWCVLRNSQARDSDVSLLASYSRELGLFGPNAIAFMQGRDVDWSNYLEFLYNLASAGEVTAAREVFRQLVPLVEHERASWQAAAALAGMVAGETARARELIDAALAPRNLTAPPGTHLGSDDARSAVWLDSLRAMSASGASAAAIDLIPLLSLRSRGDGLVAVVEGAASCDDVLLELVTREAGRYDLARIVAAAVDRSDWTNVAGELVRIARGLAGQAGCSALARLAVAYWKLGASPGGKSQELAAEALKRADSIRLESERQRSLVIAGVALARIGDNVRAESVARRVSRRADRARVELSIALAPSRSSESPVQLATEVDRLMAGLQVAGERSDFLTFAAAAFADLGAFDQALAMLDGIAGDARLSALHVMSAKLPKDDLAASRALGAAAISVAPSPRTSQRACRDLSRIAKNLVAVGDVSTARMVVNRAQEVMAHVTRPGTRAASLSDVAEALALADEMRSRSAITEAWLLSGAPWVCWPALAIVGSEAVPPLGDLLRQQLMPVRTELG
jgi:hypothetical protein